MDVWTTSTAPNQLNGKSSLNGNSVKNHSGQDALELNCKIPVECRSTNECRSSATLVDKLCEYWTNSTIHGMKYVWNRNNHVLRRMIWGLLILGANLYLYWNVVHSILRFLEFDIRSVVGVNYVPDLDFPAITICNYNQFRKSKLDPLSANLLSNIYGIQARTSDIDWAVYDDAFEDQPDVDMTEYLKSVAHQVNDTVFDCSWRSVEKCTADNFTVDITDWGVCFTFNNPDDKSQILKISQPGSRNGLFLRLDVQQWEYISGENSAAGFKVLLHPQGVRPLVRELGFSVSPGFETSVSASYTKVENLGSPYLKCRNNDEPLLYSINYTRPLCQQECKEMFVIDNCGCKDARYPGNATICPPQAYVECIGAYEERFIEVADSICNCQMPCSSEYYTSVSSIAFFPNEHVLGEILQAFPTYTENFSRKNFLDLRIFFEELSYHSVKQVPAYTGASLISDIGGTMGLMIGMSLLSVVEFIDFWVVYLTKICCKCSTSPKHNI